MITFFETVGKSIFGPRFYCDLQTRPLSYSIKYTFKLACLIALAVLIWFMVTLYPVAISYMDNFADKVSKAYPADLVVTIKDGKASTNVEEPYFVEWPADAALTDYKYALVINTKELFYEKKFDELDAFVWLTADSLAIRDVDNGYKIVSLTDIPDVVVDKDWVSTKTTHVTERVRPIATYLLPITVFIVTLLVVALFSLLYSLVFAFITWIVVWSVGLKRTYGQSYQISLHVLTTGILIFSFDFMFNFFPKFRLDFTLLTIFMVLLNFYYPDRTKPQVHASLKVK